MPEFEIFLNTYPEEIVVCMFAGFVGAAVYFLAIKILDAVCDWFHFHLVASRCKGFMTGQIHGHCHCKRCFYSSQCSHYAPYKGFFQRLKEKKNKHHC